MIGNVVVDALRDTVAEWSLIFDTLLTSLNPIYAKRLGFAHPPITTASYKKSQGSAVKIENCALFLFWWYLFQVEGVSQEKHC